MIADSPQSDGVPVPWSPPADDEGGDRPEPEPAPGRRMGFEAPVVDDLIALADDPEAIASALAGSEAAFNGAFVPLVIHDPLLAERSYDAAEWAAELIRSAGGRSLVVTPCADGDPGHGSINARQWNHAAAMIERLDGVCARFGLQLLVRDVVGGDRAGVVTPAGGSRPPGGDEGSDDIFDPEHPIGHLLDAGRFLADGYRAVELASPGSAVAGGGLMDRVRGFLRDRH